MMAHEPLKLTVIDLNVPGVDIVYQAWFEASRLQVQIDLV